MKKFTMTITLALLTTNTFAGELSLQLHGLSWHAEPRSNYARTTKPWNETNAGLGLRYTFSQQWSVQAGAYNNSTEKQTVYALATLTPLQMGPVRAGLFAGVATGYTVPVLGGAAVELGPVTVRVVPKVRNATPLVVAVEVGVPF